MNWEKITSPEFEKAVISCGGVCLLPIGVIEKHGDHLPLGQDALYIHKVCTITAEKESAIVFPLYYFGQILEAKHVPGTIAVSGELQLKILENVCDEIGRNGLKKIILVNGHGGNNNLLPFFCQLTLEQPKDYMVYLSNLPLLDEKVKKLLESTRGGQAGEVETSTMMYLYPELAKPERFSDYGNPMERLAAFKSAGLTTGVDWYSDFPGHQAAEKVQFTAEKGRAVVEAHVDYILRQIRLVKSDETPIKLYRQFHERAQKPANRYP